MTKNNVGRPLLFKTVEELKEKIEIYFKSPDCDYTITGLALALNTDRQTLINYSNREEYFDAIKRAKLIIENAYEKRLVNRGNGGDIFALKNFGWVDKTEVETKQTEPIQVNLNPVKKIK